MRPWHLRHLRLGLYLAGCCTLMGIAIVSFADATGRAEAVVTLRQLLGLWALGLLLASVIAGPLTSVLHRLPLKIHLMYGRRAIGILCFVFACAHVLTYVVPTIWTNWR